MLFARAFLQNLEGAPDPFSNPQQEPMNWLRTVSRLNLARP